VALTLDACGGAFDHKLLALLVQQRISATLFVTQRWLDANAAAVREILLHPDLFELQNHGKRHRPVLLGPDQRLYGMTGQPDLASLTAEVNGASESIQALTGRAPRYFRGAGAAYDQAGLDVIQRQGFQVAGFSVNADAGATLSGAQVAARLHSVQLGDVVLAHINHPSGGTAQGFALALPGLKARGLVFVKLSQTQLVPVQTMVRLRNPAPPATAQPKAAPPPAVKPGASG
jgi:peptidoglycan/xylan/chitin deacetylase (PgdA/CDA1 family)